MEYTPIFVFNWGLDQFDIINGGVGMTLPRLPDIWSQCINGDNYHWFPDHTDVSRCGKWRSSNAELVNHTNLNTGNTCPECMTRFFSAIFRGEPVEDPEDE